MPRRQTATPAKPDSRKATMIRLDHDIYNALLELSIRERRSLSDQLACTLEAALGLRAPAVIPTTNSEIAQ